jgi:hypothetical protein
MKSWKTTLSAVIAGTGYLVNEYLYPNVVLPHWVRVVAGFMVLVGLVGIGFYARDNDKTSEDVGAHR